MSTTKPRITITLEPFEHEVLARLSRLQKRPMSKIVMELLGEVTPVLARVADSLEVVLQSHQSVRRNFVRVAEEAEDDMKPLLEMAKNQMDLFSVAISEAAAASIDAGAAASSDGADPRTVNTGVRKSDKAASVSRKSASIRPK